MRRRRVMSEGRNRTSTGTRSGKESSRDPYAYIRRTRSRQPHVTSVGQAVRRVGKGPAPLSHRNHAGLRSWPDQASRSGVNVPAVGGPGARTGPGGSHRPWPCGSREHRATCAAADRGLGGRGARGWPPPQWPRVRARHRTDSRCPAGNGAGPRRTRAVHWLARAARPGRCPPDTWTAGSSGSSLLRPRCLTDECAPAPEEPAVISRAGQGVPLRTTDRGRIW